MTVHPIPFKGEMVKAILEGRKTQTRRVVKGKWLPLVEEVMRVNGKWVWDTLDYELTTPYGRPGDRLWLREIWRPAGWDCENGSWKIEYKDGSNSGWFEPETTEELDTNNFIRCTDECLKAGIPEDEAGFFQFSTEHPNPIKWRPSIFMPRWASRITLEVVNIKVQRVQEISGEDCVEEGITRHRSMGNFGLTGLEITHSYQKEFEILWDSINAKRGYAWNMNPWVWAIKFKVVT